MESTRRGFMGILGLATAATAAVGVPSSGGQSVLGGGSDLRSKRFLSSEYVSSESIEAGEEVYAKEVVVRIRGAKKGAFQRTIVTVSKKSEFSHPDDKLGVAGNSFREGANCKRVSVGDEFVIYGI